MKTRMRIDVEDGDHLILTVDIDSDSDRKKFAMMIFDWFNSLQRRCSQGCNVSNGSTVKIK